MYIVIIDPDISSMNGASFLINLCSLGFNITCSLGGNGIDFFKKLKHDSFELIIPSNTSIFFVHRTKSTFSCNSETKLNTSNLWLCTFNITGIIDITLTYFPSPT